MVEQTREATEQPVVRIITNAPGQSIVTAPENSLWHHVRAARQDEGLTVQQLAKKAKVSILTIHSLENGTIERLPVGAAGRREVGAVCNALGLDSEPFLAALGSSPLAPLSARLGTQRPLAIKKRRSIAMVSSVALFIIVLGTWIFGNAQSDSAAKATKTASQHATATTAFIPPPPPPTTAPPPTERVVQLTATDRSSRVQVTVDDVRVFSSTLYPGRTKEFRGAAVVISVSRPAAIETVVDGNTIPTESNMTFNLDNVKETSGQPNQNAAGVEPGSQNSTSGSSSDSSTRQEASANSGSGSGGSSSSNNSGSSGSSTKKSKTGQSSSTSAVTTFPAR